MLILSRKRILIMTCLVFVSLYAFSFKIANNMLDIEEMEKTVATVSTPVSNKVVVVDARTWTTRWAAHQVAVV